MANDHKNDENSRETSNFDKKISQELKKLKYENNSLRSQIDSVSQISNQAVQIHQENNDLRKKLKDMSAELDDYKHRYSIIVQKERENSNQYEKEKEDLSVKYQQEINELKVIISKERSEKERSVALLNEQVAVLSKKVSEQPSTSNVTQDLLTTLSRHYNYEFHNVEDIYQCLHRRNDETETDVTSSSITYCSDEIYSLKQTIKKEKSRKRKAKEFSGNLLKEIENLRNENQSTIAIANDKNNELMHVINMQEIKFNQEKQNLEFQIKLLKSTIEKNDSQKKVENSSSEREDFYHSKLINKISLLECAKENLESTIQEQKSRIKALQKQLNDSNQTIHELNTSNNTMNVSLSDISKQNELLKASMTKLSIEKDDTVQNLLSSISEIQVLHTTINTLNGENQILKNQHIEMVSALNAVEVIANNQKLEISSLYEHKKVLFTKILQIQECNKDIEALLIQKNREYEEMKGVYESLLKKTEKTPSSNGQTIPSVSWFDPGFPKELCQQLSDVATNVSLNDITKLKRVLKIIAEYYNTQEYQSQSKISLVASEFERVNGMFNEYYNKLLCIFNIEGSSSDTFPQLLTQIETKWNEMEVQFKRSIEMHEVLSQVSSILKTKSLCEIPMIITEILEQLQNDEQNQNQVQKTLQKAKKAKNTLKQKLNYLKKQWNNESDLLNGEIQSLLEQKECLLRKCSELEKKAVGLEGEIELMKSAFTHSESSKDSQTKASFQEMKSRFEAEISLKNDKIKTLENHIQQANSIRESMKKEMNQIIDSLNSCREDVSAKNNKLAELSKHITDLKSLQHKTEIIPEPNKALEEMSRKLKDKNRSMRNMIEELTNTVNEQSSKIFILTQSNNELIASIKENEDAKQLLIDEIHREKRVNESKLKSALMLNDHRNQVIIDEHVNNSEIKLRSLFSKIAQCFPQYVDLDSPLDENNIVKAIEAAKNDIYKMIKQDQNIRNILGLSKGEVADEALSKLLLKLYTTK